MWEKIEQKLLKNGQDILFNNALVFIHKKQNKKNTIFTDQTFMNLSCVLAALHI